MSGFRFRIVTRRALVRVGIAAGVCLLALAAAWWFMIRMPGSSFRGELPALTERQAELAGRIEGHVRVLAGDYAGRSVFAPGRLAGAAEYIQGELAEAGYEPARQEFTVQGVVCANIEAELPGTARPGEVIVVGAHYDAFHGGPGADDNASGVAGVLELARAFAGRPRDRTVRFVLFVNEEPPFFQTPDMGSWVYAKAARERGDNIVAMISVESIGYYSTDPGSQRYPAPLSYLYPSTGDFIGFVGNVGSRGLVREAVGSFREHAAFPSEGAALPAGIPGVGWSDHWAFWKEGYRAIMVTNTAIFRNPHYHTAGDRPETLDYGRAARVVEGLEGVVEDLAGGR